MARESESLNTSKYFSFLKNRPLRVDILTAFVGLLMTTVLIILLFSYYANSKAVLSLSEDLMNQTRGMVINETTYFLESAAAISELSSHIAPGTGLFLPKNDKFESYSVDVIKAYPRFQMMYIADEKGNFLMAKRMPDGTIATKLIDRNATPATVIWKYRNKLGDQAAMSQSHEVSYDPRLRTWYKGAKEANRTFWTDIYPFHSDGVSGITVSYPVTDRKGEFAGAVGLDIKLGELSSFLNNMKIGKTGIVFIINAKKEVVAFPDFSRLVSAFNLITDFMHEYEDTGSGTCSFEHGGKVYIGTLAGFPKSFAKDWEIVLIAPEDDFIGPLKATGRMSLLISFLLLLIAVGFAVMLARSISRPIMRLTDETERIKDFELDGELKISSNVKEIQLLNNAVKRMKMSLISFTRYAPEEIVREVVAKGREAILEGEKREITVLFSDLRGFTRLSEQHRPEQVVSLLNAHFDVMVRIISRHGGFVCDFLGDSLFAFFGALFRDPEHAQNAVNCAIEMQLARHHLNGESGDLPLEMGVGLNTGACIVGNMGSKMRIKYGAVGDAVNLGSRIESFTVGGQILISEGIHECVSSVISTFGPFEAFAKGVSGPIRMWEVRGSMREPSLTLPPTVPGLAVVSGPVAVTFRSVHEKQIGSRVYKAVVLRLSTSGADIKPDHELEVFSNIQMQFMGPDGGTASIDGKVVEADKDRCIVRFSGLDDLAAGAIRLALGSPG